MSLRELDLNLLRALQALLDTSSITRTGERLGLSQPAASRVVARLREAVGDPLLVRTSKGYVLTPRAVTLTAPVHTLLGMAEQVFAPAGFDCATANREFRVATTDYGMLTVLAPACRPLAEAAPGVILKFRPWIDETLEELEQGRLDIALYADDELPPDFHTRDLYRETYSVLMRAGHALADRRTFTSRASLNVLADYPHVVVTYPLGRRHMPDDILAQLKGPAHRVALETPFFLAAPWLLAETDRVMILPSRAATELARQFGLCCVALRIPELSFSYRLVWHERAHRDPGLTWLRQTMVAALTQDRR